MPGKVKVKIISGRNLPVMDRSSDTTDAYVELKLGGTTYKTDVCRKSLNPNWNSDWYKFEVDDSELQDEPLQIRLMDHDTYSANDAIGKVYIDLNPLLLPVTSNLWKYNRETSNNHEPTSNFTMSGWFPVYDTMHGIRGEVKVTVKVELFSDFNKFRQSSCGVHFFCSPVIPHGYHAQIIHGFVEELIVSDDPEYQWIDKIRTPRASNEARQTLFFKLSGELQRKIGVKALDLGGNAVIGYSQCFDLEGESGIVARGIGTAITLIKILDFPHQPTTDSAGEERAQSYLKFLGSDSSFRLNNEPNLYVHNRYFYPLSPTLSLTSMRILTDERKPITCDVKLPQSRHITRHLSQTDFYQSSTKGNIHHSSSLQTLLKQEDLRGTSGGISQRFRNFRNSSQNMLSKKMIALKAKLSDSGMIDELADNQSTIADTKKKKGVFKRTVSESNAMAEILVRSVIQAHSSLDSISETQNNPTKPSYQKQQSLVEIAGDESVKNSPELDSYLSLPDANLDTHSSNATSSCDSSSDEEEEEDNLSDIKDNDVVLDTVSDIVKNVEIIQRKLSLQAHQHAQNLVDDPQYDELTKDYISISGDDDLKSENISDVSEEINKVNKDYDSISDCIDLENAHQNLPSLKTIIPSVKDNNAKPPGLFKTAMQTMLLEKINLVGTYTPPTSPNTIEKFDYKEPNKIETGTKALEKHLTFKRNQSPTSFSLMEFDHRDTVLGARFKSLHDLKDQNNCSKPDRSLSFDQYPGNKKHKHFHLHFKSILRHKHKKSPSLHSLRDLPESKESFSHWLTHIIKHKKHGRASSPSSSLVDTRDLKDGVFKHFTSFSHKLKHKKYKHTNSPMSLSLAELASTDFDNDVIIKNRPTSISLADLSTKESVLGGPFTSILQQFKDGENVKSIQSLKSVVSEEEEKIVDVKVKPVVGEEIKKEIFRQRTYSNPTPSAVTRRRTCSENASVDEMSVEAKPTPLSHYVIKPRIRTYSDSHKKEKQRHEWDFRSLKHKISGSLKTRTKEKSKGLLKTALQTVLMESVNDILATSHTVSKDKDNQVNNTNGEIKEATFTEKYEHLNDNTKSVPLPVTPDILIENPVPSESMQADKAPINTKIDVGISNNNINTLHACLTPSLRNIGSPLPDGSRTESGHHRTESVGAKISHSPAKMSAIPSMHRRSSDSDLSITPKGNSLTGSDRSGGWSGYIGRNAAILRHTVPQENFDILEYPFLTMSKYPAGFIAHLGGTVSARSVKLLERITNFEEPESRDTWWSEIRMEIRSHARALNCNAVLGYTETTSICEDICVLSASGTAAIIGYQFSGEAGDNVGNLPNIHKPGTTCREIMTTSLDRNDFEKDKSSTKACESITATNPKTLPESPEKDPFASNQNNIPACTLCHMPYNSNSMPLRNSTSKCRNCKSGKVPDVLISTIEIPEGIPIIGRGCFLQSHVCRPLKDSRGESNAKEISDGLPFLEYELHRLLVNKLKVKGMNAIFGLKVRISIGERMLIGIATGTAVFLSALPSPSMPKLVSDRASDEEKLTKLQKDLHTVIKRNKEVYQLKQLDEIQNGKILSDTDDSEEEQVVVDFSMGNKDCCILEVDDPEDKEVVNLIMEPRPPDGFHVVNSELVPGLDELEIVKNLQMFIQIWRAKIQSPFNLDKELHKLLQTVYFKLRRMIPCALCDLQFRVNSPEPDEVQLCVLGMALGLGDPLKEGKLKRKIIHNKRTDEDLIFNLEEDNIPENSVPQQNVNFLHTQMLKHRQKSPQRLKSSIKQRHMPYRERHGVDITPLSYVPGGKIERYLGNLNFFFIRETTSIREEGGLSGFLHSFITEVLAIVRAHVTALGGNAMVAYFMTECILNHNLHKNQGQCLINVGGDVVVISYSEDMQ